MAGEMLWEVTYTYEHEYELDLNATFTIRAPSASEAITQSLDALAVMFTARAREVLQLYSVVNATARGE